MIVMDESHIPSAHNPEGMKIAFDINLCAVVLVVPSHSVGDKLAQFEDCLGESLAELSIIFGALKNDDGIR